MAQQAQEPILKQASKRVLASLGGSKGVPDVDGLAIVELDDDGTVLGINSQARKLCRLEKAQPVGQSFFVSVAPWAANQVFFGRFRKGVDDDAMDASFRYFLTFLTTPQEITVRLYRDAQSKRNWVLMGPA